MAIAATTPRFNWTCRTSWLAASKNTAWCLLGCAIGDFGTILFFQLTEIPWPVLAIMILAIINGILTSIALETVVLLRQMKFAQAFRTAVGMSLISMISMEAAMNLVDYLVMGGAKLSFAIIPLMLFVGFITALPYNYWRLKKYGRACH